MNFALDGAMVLTDKLREQFGTGLADSHALRADFTMDQPMHYYQEDDHHVWRELYQRQMNILQGRACDEFLRGADQMGLDRGVPDFAELNAILAKTTGWQVVVVPGLVPDLVFFDHLANKRFPASWWVRKRDQMDYLQEPDGFHDVFGHVPLLNNPIFADYMQAYGKAGVRAHALGLLPNLARLYWYTVEFGLINTPAGQRIYGAGIVSSKGESVFCLESNSPHRIRFEVERVLRTQYRIDTYQNTYFVIDSFDHLFNETQKDFSDIYQTIQKNPTLEFQSYLTYSQDQIITEGDQSFYKAGIGI